MSKQATVREASASPPPLPNEPLPEASGSGTSTTSTVAANDVPINTLGNEDASDDESEAGKTLSGPNEVEDDDDDEEWDPAEERLPGQSSASAKGKEKAVEGEGQEQPWQAVWAAEQNAWYFWNSTTGEVTWTNPLEPNPPLPNEPAPPPLPNEPVPPPLPEGNFGQIPDIDPDLAYLLPATQRGGAGVSAEGQSASFNARTGKFQPTDNSYAIGHLEEWNRAKRMAGKYFDVDAWEQGLREENAKRKREAEMGVQEEKKITKKDMDRFKKKKAEQKYRKQAWLRD